jgi:hypothetical protein
VPKSVNLKGGSRKGIPNKATQSAREAIAAFVDGNAHRLQAWLSQIAEGIPKEDGEGWVVRPDPARAADMFLGVVEYHIPKLARTESTISGPDGGPIKQHWTVEMVRPK